MLTDDSSGITPSAANDPPLTTADMFAATAGAPPWTLPAPRDRAAIDQDNRALGQRLHDRSSRVRAGAGRAARDSELFYARLMAADRRAARDAERVRAILAGELMPEPQPGTWEGHLMWLLTVFGDRQFITPAVRDAALAAGGQFIPPPAFTVRNEHWRYGTVRREADPAAPDFALRLGQAYAPVAAGEPVRGWLELRPGGVTHNRRRWHVFAKAPFPPP